MALWDSNVLVTVLLIVAGCLVRICLSGLHLPLIQGVLVYSFWATWALTKGCKLGFNP